MVEFDALRRFASTPPGGALLRTWISHTVPHITISFTADSLPGIPNWLVAASVGVASIFVLGTTLRGCYAEMSAAQHRELASSAQSVEGEMCGKARSSCIGLSAAFWVDRDYFCAQPFPVVFARVT